MLAHLADADFATTTAADEADVIVVNTCGFIEDAKAESIDVIFEMARHKEAGACKRLVVTGCLVQRYGEALAEQIPEIDHLLGNGAYADVAKVAASVTDSPRVQIAPPTFIHDATTPRINTFMAHSAYVKVAEGCDQKCTFCIIPKLRGRQRSRAIADVVVEAEHLAERGVRELNLIAQDLTGYGHDLDPKADLAALLRALGQVEVPWIRLHYAYPRPFSLALLAAIAEEPRILPYIDMPLQHIADPVLKRMRRGRPRRFIEKLLGDIRAAVPDVTLRTSFIVGFPGETDADFAELCQWVRDQSFERVGVFKYSLEEDTDSYDLPDRVPQPLIDARHHTLMEILRERSRTHLAAYVGKRLEVLVDGVSDETDLLLAGRHKGQAPEIDGTTYINDGEAGPGDLVEVEIEETFDYDLVGPITAVIAAAPPRPDNPRLEAPRSAVRAATLGAVGARSLPVMR